MSESNEATIHNLREALSTVENELQHYVATNKPCDRDVAVYLAMIQHHMNAAVAVYSEDRVDPMKQLVAIASLAIVALAASPEDLPTPRKTPSDVWKSGTIDMTDYHKAMEDVLEQLEEFKKDITKGSETVFGELLNTVSKWINASK